jgi:rhamnosyltransferase
MTPLSPRVCAIIVTYQPEAPILARLIKALSHQTHDIIIVDNSPSAFPSLEHDQKINGVKIEYIPLDRNMGIAYAQNVGIEWAIKRSGQYVLLMDQDSVPDKSMVKNLLAAFNDQKNIDQNLIAAGPVYIDPRNLSKSSFITSKFGFPCRSTPTESTGSISAAFLISSGSLILVSKLLEVGGMNSNYFIDHVDTEWCFRAKSKGYTLIGQPSAIMQHALGDQIKKVWILGWKSVAYHSPLRDYYMFRNTILMLSNSNISYIWSCFLLWRLVKYAIYFLLFAKERWGRLTCMLLGLHHGFKKIDGELILKKHWCLPIPKTKLDPKL